jgi:hypothetical protein
MTRRLILVLTVSFVVSGSIALSQTTTTQRIRVTTEAPPPAVDPICPNSHPLEMERWTMQQRIREIKTSDEAIAFQTTMLDKSNALAASYEACATSYADAPQKQSHYHATVRAGSSYLAIGNTLIALYRTAEAQTALQKGKALLDRAISADENEITPSDLKIARVSHAVFEAELRGIAERGGSYSPSGMFRALASPLPTPSAQKNTGPAPPPDPICPDVEMLPYRIQGREATMENARAQAADYFRTTFLTFAQAWDACAAHYSSETQLPKWAHARERAISARVAAAGAAQSGHDSAAAKAILEVAKSQLADLLRLNDGAIDPADRRAAETLAERIDLFLKGIAEQGDAFTPPRPTPTPGG